MYSPWLAPDFQARYNKIKQYTLVSDDRCYILETLAKNVATVPGEIWECGVYRGGTALWLGDIALHHNKRLRLFDTFAGMPETNPLVDNHHREGDFADTSATKVMNLLNKRLKTDKPFISMHQGCIPQTFTPELHDKVIAFAHVDVDIYQSVVDCCKFIWPRLSVGGMMVFDDYGWSSCKGALLAVNDFFHARHVYPLALRSGQALVVRTS